MFHNDRHCTLISFYNANLTGSQGEEVWGPSNPVERQGVIANEGKYLHYE